jgi:hypothetical protein
MPLPAAAQLNDEKYAGYFLVGRFGEVCTMCEVMVLCEAGAAPAVHGAVPAAGSFTLYHIQTRTFWSQVATIWEWFVSNFSPRPLVGGHSRPVIVHQVEDGAWAPPVAGDMHISLEPPLMSMPDGREIDRVGRRWRVASPPADIGYCERLPLWDALAVIDQQQSGSTAQ